MIRTAEAAYPPLAFAQWTLMTSAHLAARAIPAWGDEKRFRFVLLVFFGSRSLASYRDLRLGRSCVRPQCPSAGIIAAVFHPESGTGARGRERVEDVLTRTHGRTQRPERGALAPLGATGACAPPSVLVRRCAGTARRDRRLRSPKRPRTPGARCAGAARRDGRLRSPKRPRTPGALCSGTARRERRLSSPKRPRTPGARCAGTARRDRRLRPKASTARPARAPCPRLAQS